VVTEYLREAGLTSYLDQLRFNLVGYGCTTCIGNSGPLPEEVSRAIDEGGLVACAVLSGNRNFEARIHPNLKANFLASPPLVVAYAIAGTVLRDLMTEPVGQGTNGRDIFLGDIWPTSDEVHALLKFAMNPKAFQANYGKVKTEPGELWGKIKGVSGQVYDWPTSTYIAKPPFFDSFTMQPAVGSAPGVTGARIIGLFGDSITTDHISPAGSIKDTSPAGKYLLAQGVLKPDFNSYGSRRGNHELMMRGTFANVRIKNLMMPPAADGSREEGGVTLHQPSGDRMFIYDAAMRYIAEGTPTVVLAGEEYGTGSSRDWAAKGTQLLGVKAVVAKSFERIHRSNLVGMGVLPLQFKPGHSIDSLGLRGDEVIDIVVSPQLKPQSDAKLVATGSDGSRREAALTLRIDTPIEVDYYQHGGILPFVLRQLLAA
jgi:aconitate hydratase